MNVRTNETRELVICIRRDMFYHIEVQTMESQQPGVAIMNVELRWRSGGMPIGVTMENKVSAS